MGFKKDMENPGFPVGKMLSFPAPVGREIRWPNPGNQSTEKMVSSGESLLHLLFVGYFFLRPNMTYFNLF